eukprot:scaffold4648_cov295-Prasinococcus_capsulatus_cf.AAC.5
MLGTCSYCGKCKRLVPEFNSAAEHILVGVLPYVGCGSRKRTSELHLLQHRKVNLQQMLLHWLTRMTRRGWHCASTLQVGHVCEAPYLPLVKQPRASRCQSG